MLEQVYKQICVKTVNNFTIVPQLRITAFRGFIVGLDLRTNASNSLNYCEGHIIFL